MITIDNQEVKDLTIDGTPVNEVTMDGVIVWQRLSDIWKRRIMVGDNLRGKTVYQDFPVGYHTQITSEMNLVIGSTTFIKTSFVASSYLWILSSIAEGSQSIYYFDDIDDEKIEQFGNPLTKNDKDYIVTSVSNEKHYRHLFIEDPNIRPIEVGDNLSGATLYFTFPDDFHQKIDQLSGSFAWTNNTTLVAYFDSGDSTKTVFTTSGLSIYNYNVNSGVLLDNISKSILGNDFGIIEYLDKSHPAYNHILVDTTTMLRHIERG